MGDLFSTLTYVKVLLDDVLISSSSMKEHKTHLRKVLDILQKAKASINFEKLSFCKSGVTYLGKIVFAKRIKPDISRVEKF